MAKKPQGTAAREPDITDGSGGTERMIRQEPTQKTREIPCKATDTLTVINGNELLFTGGSVESVTVRFRGD